MYHNNYRNKLDIYKVLDKGGEFMNLKRGDIIRVKRMSYDLGDNVQDNEGMKRRLYIVISNDTNNLKSPTINIACLSTQIDKAYYPMHVFLNKNNYNCFEKNNMIMTEQVFTINKNRVKGIVDSLNEKDLRKLNKAIYIQLIDEKRKVVNA